MASQWTSAPCAWAIRLTSATGWITPVSLLTRMTETSAGSGFREQSSSASRSTSPSAVTGTRSASGTVSSTLSCSIDETRTRVRPVARRAAVLASVPPDVNTTRAGVIPPAPRPPPARPRPPGGRAGRSHGPTMDCRRCRRRRSRHRAPPAGSVRSRCSPGRSDRAFSGHSDSSIQPRPHQVRRPRRAA